MRTETNRVIEVSHAFIGKHRKLNSVITYVVLFLNN